MTQFTKQYFIDKFSAIPDELWTTHRFKDSFGRCCALGHCGEDYYNPRAIEANALMSVLSKVGQVDHINDGKEPRFQQPTPKARILAALDTVEE